MDGVRSLAELALEALRACWTIVSTQHRDAVSDNIERMGAALALDAENWKLCEEVIGEARAHMQQFGGVLMARCEHVFREQ